MFVYCMCVCVCVLVCVYTHINDVAFKLFGLARKKHYLFIIDASVMILIMQVPDHLLCEYHDRTGTL